MSLGTILLFAFLSGVLKMIQEMEFQFGILHRNGIRIYIRLETKIKLMAEYWKCQC